MHLPAQDCAVYRGCCHPQALWYRRRRRRGCCRLLVVVKNDICCSRCKGQGRLWHIQYTVILVTYTHRRLRSSKQMLLELAAFRPGDSTLLPKLTMADGTPYCGLSGPSPLSLFRFGRPPATDPMSPARRSIIDGDISAGGLRR